MQHHTDEDRPDCLPQKEREGVHGERGGAGTWRQLRHLCLHGIVQHDEAQPADREEAGLQAPGQAHGHADQSARSHHATSRHHGGPAHQPQGDVQAQRIADAADAEGAEHEAGFLRPAQTCCLQKLADVRRDAIKDDAFHEDRAEAQIGFRIGEHAAVAIDRVREANMRPCLRPRLAQQDGGAHGCGEGKAGDEKQEAAPADRHRHESCDAGAKDHAREACHQESPDRQLPSRWLETVANHGHGDGHDASRRDAANEPEGEQGRKIRREITAQQAEGQQPEADPQDERLAVEIADGSEDRLAEGIGKGIGGGEQGGGRHRHGKIARDFREHRVHRPVGQGARKAAENEDDEDQGCAHRMTARGVGAGMGPVHAPRGFVRFRPLRSD